MSHMLENHALDVQHLKLAQAAGLDPQTEALFDRIFGRDAKMPEANSTISTGQIDAMAAPAGWVRRDNANLRAGADLVEYHPPGNDDIRINSFYRGSRVDGNSAKAFKDCLNKAPHMLKADELKTLGPILSDKSYDFNILSAKTEDLNGKRVLIVEGRYKDAARTTSQTMYVDSDGTGSAVQEISYTAPGPDYQANLVKAQSAFKSIAWRKN